jgi:hypothetical protein
MTLDVVVAVDDDGGGGVGMSSSCAVVDERMVRVVVKVWHYAYCMDSLRYGGIVLTTKLIIWVRERTLLLLMKKE